MEIVCLLPIHTAVIAAAFPLSSAPDNRTILQSSSKLTPYGQLTIRGRRRPTPPPHFGQSDSKTGLAPILLYFRPKLFYLKERQMYHLFEEAAKQHELAAESHRAAAESDEIGEALDANNHTRRAMEHSIQANQLAAEAHFKSGAIGSL